MKQRLIVVLLTVVMVVVMVSMTRAASTNCVPPCLPCPPVQVTCDCTQITLPGLWVVSVLGEEKCGTITVVGDGFLLEREGKADYFLINRMKRAKQVESCD
jgi:hypothetical protein